MASIAQNLKDLMQERDADIVWSGDPDLCIEAYMRFGGKIEHPLDRIKAVIDAARRSKLFVQDGYIRACDRTGTREILHPCFKVAETTTN